MNGHFLTFRPKNHNLQKSSKYRQRLFFNIRR